MPRIVRTKIGMAQIKALKPGDTVRDSEMIGFGARCQRNCVTYFLQTEIRGRVRWITIGRHGSPWTPDSARREALQLKAQIAAGEDPAEAWANEKRELTVAEAVERFKTEHVPKLKDRTRGEYNRQLDADILPVLGRRKIRDVGPSDASAMHAKLSGTPAKANRVLAVLSKLMSWAEAQKWRDRHTNPCMDVRKYRENKRERYLSEAELGRIGEALVDAEANGRVSIYAAAALRLLMLTGARLREILTLKWDYVYLDRGVILLPDSKTGAKPLVLNEAAIEILKALPRLDNNPHVIVGQVAGNPIVNLEKPWRRIRSAAGLDDVRIHDLRHSFASVAAAAGGSLPLIGKLLGHRQPQTTARYAHLADDPLRKLNNDVGSRVLLALRGKGFKASD